MKKIDYGKFINKQSSRRRPAITREIAQRMSKFSKDTVSLAEGMPNEATFLFDQISVRLRDGSTFCLKDQELATALQYGPTRGYPPLVSFLKEFTNIIHKPPNWEDFELIVTSGSQSGISKSIEMCLEEGDSLLVQNPFYCGTNIACKPLKLNVIGISQDQDGLIPQNLINTLETLKMQCENDNSLKMPKMIYINPTAANPTGATLTLERKKAIYKICCDYNILIIEDDPYYFLDFHDARPVSFLSMDTNSRVIRLDSCSKVLGPGLRIGWVTAPKRIINQIELHVQSSYLHASSMSQVLLENTFRNLGIDKLLEHMESLRKYYKIRRDITLDCMNRHLKTLCDWTEPSGGMFVWIKVRNVSDVTDMLLNRAVKKRLALVPGLDFMADPTAACNFIRAAYSKLTPTQIDRGFELLAELIIEEQQLLNRKLSGLG